MSSYKVAQDVEAEDKLIGPFTFRQFIYLIIVAISIAIAWALSRILLPLAIIPLPLIIVFGALALPLKKDQPMEVYLGALLSYYLKPRKRVWLPDGIESLIEVTVPKVTEIQRTKDLSESEAIKRLSYLAGIADTGGWAIRRANEPNTSLAADVYYDAQQSADDILQTENQIGQKFNGMINEADQLRKQRAIEAMYSSNVQDNSQQLSDPHVAYNPYPTMQQTTIQPMGVTQYQQVTPTQHATQPIQPTPIQTQIETQNTSTNPVSPDIIELANNGDLSVETIAREAHRREQKKDNDEVVISLR